MDFVKWGLNPWGQNILTHVSWTLFWASLFAGLMFLVAHGSYMLLSAHRKRPETETDRLLGPLGNFGRAGPKPVEDGGQAQHAADEGRQVEVKHRENEQAAGEQGRQ